MSSFTEARIVEVTARLGRRNRRALFAAAEEFSWEFGKKGSGERITVPKGFVSDGPSIPKWLKWLFGWAINVQSMMKSSFIHDLMRQQPGVYTKLVCDATFLMCMEAERTPVVQRWFAFFLVLFNRSRDTHGFELQQ